MGSSQSKKGRTILVVGAGQRQVSQVFKHVAASEDTVEAKEHGGLAVHETGAAGRDGSRVLMWDFPEGTAVPDASAAPSRFASGVVLVGNAHSDPNDTARLVALFALARASAVENAPVLLVRATAGRTCGRLTALNIRAAAGVSAEQAEAGNVFEAHKADEETGNELGKGIDWLYGRI
jgi:hypothetical protein